MESGESYGSDLVFVVSELETPNSISTRQFRLKRAFAAEPPVSTTILDGVLCDERTCRVSAVILDHRMPCLGFALQEAAHVTFGKIVYQSAGFRSVRGCSGSSRRLWKAVRTII